MCDFGSVVDFEWDFTWTEINEPAPFVFFFHSYKPRKPKRDIFF